MKICFFLPLLKEIPTTNSKTTTLAVIKGRDSNHGNLRRNSNHDNMGRSSGRGSRYNNGSHITLVVVTNNIHSCNCFPYGKICNSCVCGLLHAHILLIGPRTMLVQKLSKLEFWNIRCNVLFLLQLG